MPKSTSSSHSQSSYASSEYAPEDFLSNSSAIFISAPHAGKSTLLSYIIEQQAVPESDIPDILPPSAFEIPVGAHDGNVANILLELTDTKSFELGATVELTAKNVEGTVRRYQSDIVVLVLDSTQDEDAMRNVTLAALNVMQQNELQLFIVQSKVDLLKDGALKSIEELIPELRDYVYYRGSATFTIHPTAESSTFDMDADYEEEEDPAMEFLAAQLFGVIFKLTNMVMYSVQELVDARGEFRPLFARAVKRIHWILQHESKPGYIESDQLEKMKEFILEPSQEGGSVLSQLTEESLDELLRDAMSVDGPGHATDRLTLPAFSALIKRLILQNEIVIVWGFLHDADYTDELDIDDSSLFNVIPSYISPEYYLGVSARGEALLTKAFKYFDHDNDGLLNVSSDLEEAFEFMDASPFPRQLLGVCRLIENKDTGGLFLPLNSWLSLWNIVALQQPIQVARCLQIWGFSEEEIREYDRDESALDMVRKPMYRNYAQDSNAREVDNLKTFLVYIFGASRSGKSAFRACMTGKPFDPNFEMDYPFSTFTYEYDNKECHVILRECDSALLDDKEAMSLCDAAVMIFDGSDRYSFSVLPSIHRKLQKTIPVVYIQTHAEVSDVEQEYEETPKAFWEALGLPSTPLYFSATHHTEEEFQEIRETILCLCHEPDLGQIKVEDDDELNDSALLEQLDEREIQRRENRKVVGRVLSVVLGMATVSGLGYLAWRFAFGSSKKSAPSAQ